MMLEEFEKRTGYFPTLEEYEAIEQAYMSFDGDKDAFCKAYKKNEGGLAEKIQHKANLQRINTQRKLSKNTKPRSQSWRNLWSRNWSGKHTRTRTTCSRQNTKSSQRRPEPKS